jgi:hypothetical protein
MATPPRLELNISQGFCGTDSESREADALGEGGMLLEQAAHEDPCTEPDIRRILDSLDSR